MKRKRKWQKVVGRVEGKKKELDKEDKKEKKRLEKEEERLKKKVDDWEEWVGRFQDALLKFNEEKGNKQIV